MCQLTWTRVACITVTQIQQEEMSEEYGCLIGGIQEGLNFDFYISLFWCSVSFSRPK